MVQPGQEANSPWGDSSSNGDGPSSGGATPPQPIVLGGASGLSVNTEVQGQMPAQFAPSAGSTLTGQVGVIDSSVWAAQQAKQSNGSFLKGMVITVIFGFFIVFLPAMLGGWADSNRWDDKVEPLSIEWNETRTSGTFQISGAPIDSCSMSIYQMGGDRWSEGSVNFYDDCDGTLYMNLREERVTFTMVGDTSGEYTYHPSSRDQVGQTVQLTLLYYERGQIRQELGSQELDENLSQLTFTVDTSDWEECFFELEVQNTDGRNNMWPDYNRWQSPPDCPDISYEQHWQETVGAIDYKSGFGDIYLDNPLDSDVEYEVSYYPGGSNGGPSVYEIAPCFGGIGALILFIVWIIKVVQSFQAGLTNQGTGMLVGIIPAVIFSVFSAIIISLMMFGF